MKHGCASDPVPGAEIGNRHSCGFWNAFPHVFLCGAIRCCNGRLLESVHINLHVCFKNGNDRDSPPPKHRCAVFQKLGVNVLDERGRGAVALIRKRPAVTDCGALDSAFRNGGFTWVSVAQLPTKKSNVISSKPLNRNEKRLRRCNTFHIRSDAVWFRCASLPASSNQSRTE